MTQMQASYHVVREISGVNRVLVEQSLAGQDPQVYMGPMMVDQKVDLSKKFFKEMAGTYRTVQTGTYSKYANTVYDFNSDGFGGFNTHHNGKDNYTIWKWDWKNQKMTASSYFDQKNFRMPETKQELQLCLSDMANCQVIQSRDYEILAQDGNRYVMLRRMEFFDFTGKPRAPENYTLWVMYKR